MCSPIGRELTFCRSSRIPWMSVPTSYKQEGWLLNMNMPLALQWYAERIAKGFVFLHFQEGVKDGCGFAKG